MILDIVGGDYIARNLDLLSLEGRLLQIAFLKTGKAELDFSIMMRKRAWITGSTLRPRTPAEKGTSRATCTNTCGRCSNRAPSHPSSTRHFRSRRPPMRIA